MTKYLRVYELIIERAKNRLTKGYVERHHILPKSLGGNDNSSNIVRLTAKEHYIVHHLLWRHYKSIEDKSAEQKMLYAYWAMSTQKKDNRRYINANSYENLRVAYSKMKSISMSGKGNINYGNRDYKHSAETRKKISESQKGKVRGPMSSSTKNKISVVKSGKTLSEEHKNKIGIGCTGKKHSIESIKKMSDSKLGIPRSQETKDKVRKTLLANRITVTCPHCNKSGYDSPGMRKWHFDNCRKLL